MRTDEQRLREPDGRGRSCQGLLALGLRLPRGAAFRGLTLERSSVAGGGQGTWRVGACAPSFEEELARMRWVYRPLGGGYGRIEGGVYTGYLIETAEVATAGELQR